MEPIIFVLFAAAIITVAIFAWLSERKKREAMAAYAAQRGMSFSADDPVDFPKQYGKLFSLMSAGHSRQASCVLAGQVAAGRQRWVFEYRYKTGSGKHEHTHHHVCCLWQLPLELAALSIRPEGLLDGIGSWFGQNDIDFESIEFSKRYYVKGDEPREVYALITPQMMEFMMSAGLKYLEVNGDRALVYADETDLTPERADRLLAMADGLEQRLPGHLLREKSATPGPAIN